MKLARKYKVMIIFYVLYIIILIFVAKSNGRLEQYRTEPTTIEEKK